MGVVAVRVRTPYRSLELHFMPGAEINVVEGFIAPLNSRCNAVYSLTSVNHIQIHKKEGHLTIGSH